MKRVLKILILATIFAFYKVVSLVYREKGVAVLMYHSIGRQGGLLAVNPEDFERQLEYLKNSHYQFLTIEELLSKNTWEVGSKRVLLTFDDGYRDFLTAAFFVLKKFDIPAVAFIHTSRSSENLGNNFPMLNWDEIRELKKNGLTIGNHSHQHVDLKKLSPEELAAEVKVSESIFQKELGHIPKVFAYPGGKYNSQVVEFLHQHGYEAAFTIDQGVVSKNDTRLKLKRIGVDSETTMFEFRLILTRAFNWYQFLRKIKNWPLNFLHGRVKS